MNSPTPTHEDDSAGCILILIFAILLGIVAQFVVPKWFHSPRKNGAAEAKTYIGSMNRAQQAYFIEHEALTEDLDALGLGITSETDLYAYRIESLREMAIQNVAIAKESDFKSYVGLVWVAIDSPNGDTSRFTPKAQVCEAEALTWVPPVFELPELPINSEESIPCPEGYQPL